MPGRKERTSRQRMAAMAFVASLLALFCLAVPNAQAAACNGLIASGNPEYPPYLWPDTKDDTHLIGANAELMARLSAEIGIPIEVRHIGSWARVQEEMKSGR